MGANFAPAERRVFGEAENDTRGSGQVAAFQPNFHLLAPLAAKRKNRLDVRQSAGIEPISVVAAALITEIANLHNVLPVLRDRKTQP